MAPSRNQPQPAPIRLHQTETQFVIAAPLPGLEPQDIGVIVDGQEVTITGDCRGPERRERDVLLDEWSPGPYERRVTLPTPVDAAAANASYGNGVLVLSLPKAGDGHHSTLTSFRLEPLEPTRGRWLGRPAGAPAAA